MKLGPLAGPQVLLELGDWGGALLRQTVQLPWHLLPLKTCSEARKAALRLQDADGAVARLEQLLQTDFEVMLFGVPASCMCPDRFLQMGNLRACRCLIAGQTLSVGDGTTHLLRSVQQCSAAFSGASGSLTDGQHKVNELLEELLADDSAADVFDVFNSWCEVGCLAWLGKVGISLAHSQDDMSKCVIKV